MADPRKGTAGTVVLVFYIVGIIILVSQVSDKLQLFSLIIVAEALSKYSMVLQCYLGKSAWEGLNTIFIAEMKNKKKIIVSTILIFAILIIFGLSIYQIIISVIGMLFVTFLLLIISHRSFGGISGDIIGACNELSRFVIYFMYIIFI
jgi:adenosylcobinamide-GDP ribazoletransferase